MGIVLSKQQKKITTITIIVFLLLIPIILWAVYFSNISQYNHNLGGNIARMAEYSTLYSRLLISYWFGFSILTGIFASSYKGLSTLRYFILSLVLSPVITIFIIFMIKTNYDSNFCISHQIKECPYCKEYINMYATKCRYCSSTLDKDNSNEQIEAKKPKQESLNISERFKNSKQTIQEIGDKESQEMTNSLNLQDKKLSRYDIVVEYIGNDQLLYNLLMSKNFTEKEIEFLNRCSEIIQSKKEKTDSKFINRAYLLLKKYLTELQ